MKVQGDLTGHDQYGGILAGDNMQNIMGIAYFQIILHNC
jgi:hypothetical protein